MAGLHRRVDIYLPEQAADGRLRVLEHDLIAQPDRRMLSELAPLQADTQVGEEAPEVVGHDLWMRLESHQSSLTSFEPVLLDPDRAGRRAIVLPSRLQAIGGSVTVSRREKGAEARPI
jgi:hypothetical protein